MIKDTNIGRLILESISQNQATKTASAKLDIDEARKVSDGLVKIASYPYKESVYQSVREIMKIASSIIDEAGNEIENIRARNSDLEKAAEVRTMVDDMINYGLIDDGSTKAVQEKIAELLKKDRPELEIVKKAMEMVKGSKSNSTFFDKEAQIQSAGDRRRSIFDGVLD